MLNLVWSARAREDVARIFTYIAEHDLDAAVNVRNAIARCADRLLSFPLMYPEGRVAGTREALAHPNYILFYRLEGDVVEVTGVMHARRRYP